MEQVNLVVFTDLDGTLLDHETYSYAPAQPALERLASCRIPLILASSKTAGEMAPIRQAIGFSHAPMICENGGGIVPGGVEGRVDRSGYWRLRDALDRMPPDLRSRFEGFGDMSVARVREVTGLPEADAVLAKERAFTEPGLWSGPGEDSFVEALEAFAITARRGGRFLTLGAGTTKADRLSEITSQYGASFTVALGDAPNDAEMLLAADRGILIPNPHAPDMSDLIEQSEGRIALAEEPGPAGWARALGLLLDELGYQDKGERHG
ncbi:mannosyl-3-phosphoglycerate phosphatase [Thalassococcus sp. S3]|uniref:HAD-IIB family hydrolase n=1 Tax=Thalassococcus sp. S3 TaxID=2017482 RepID=UPI0010241109|nr:HAD-IIB family hydrolase [Thalassococcus sp. S3]QBF30584.1 mannosyl-3-phosphoglycerate phosphatase [Thalassococcus sp. S3]